MSDVASIGTGDVFSDFLVNVETAIQSAGASAASSSAAAGEFKVDLAELVNFYNQLYRIHLEVERQVEVFHSRSAAVAAASVSGGVTGVHAAWTAVAHTAGAEGPTASSLVGSLRALDSQLRKFLVQLHDAYVAYVKADQVPAATFRDIAGQLS